MIFNSIPERLSTLLHEAKKSFSSAVLVAENADYSSALMIAERSMGFLDSLAQELAQSSPDLKNRLDSRIKANVPFFHENFEKAKKLSETSHVVPAIQAKHFLQLLEDLEVMISLFESEIRKTFSKPIEFQKIWARHKISLVILTSIIGVSLVYALAIKPAQLKKNGLKGEYFRDMNLTDLALVKKDPNISFNWGQKPLSPGLAPDGCSIRWSGKLKISKTGDYQFSALSDDGVRLWVNEQLVIQDWKSHGPTTNTGNIYLQKGVYPIRLEYMEDFGNAMVILSWKTPGSSATKIIPQKNFIPVS